MRACASRANIAVWTCSDLRVRFCTFADLTNQINVAERLQPRTLLVDVTTKEHINELFPPPLSGMYIAERPVWEEHYTTADLITASMLLVRIKGPQNGRNSSKHGATLRRVSTSTSGEQTILGSNATV